MISKNSFVAGRVYSIVYSSDVDMVAKRNFGTERNPDIQENPLRESLVTVRRVSTVQAAGEKTWTNFLAKRGMVPAGTAPTWWTVSKENSCIVVGTSKNTLGREYLRGLPRGITKEEFFIDGKPATPAQIETMKRFKKNSGGDFVLLALSKLENVDTGEGEAE